MIDLHSHVLPGLDDGARTLGDSLEMAAGAVDDGITILVATPHVRDDYPTTAAVMERSLGEVREALAGAGIPLDLRGGGEISLGRLGGMTDADLARFGLGGSPSYVLLEFPYVGWPPPLAGTILSLRGKGVTPVIAHPERNGEVQADPERLRSAVLAGALVQVTAASVDGRLGRRARAAAFDLIDRGLAHVVASDAHTPDIRGIGISAAAAALHDEELAHWLTVGVPAAILDGDAPPARPPKRRRRLFGL